MTLTRQNPAPTAATPVATEKKSWYESHDCGNPNTLRNDVAAARPQDHQSSGRMEIADPANRAATKTSTTRVPSSAVVWSNPKATSPSTPAVAASAMPTIPVLRTAAGSHGGTASAGVNGIASAGSRSMVFVSVDDLSRGRNWDRCGDWRQQSRRPLPSMHRIRPRGDYTRAAKSDTFPGRTATAAMPRPGSVAPELKPGIAAVAILPGMCRAWPRGRKSLHPFTITHRRRGRKG